MKKYIFLAASALALASCSSDDFLGDTPGSTPTSANSAINFGGDAGKITRATSNEGTPQQMLNGQFLVYGVKKTSNEIFHNVFVNYSVWDVEANNTTSNTRGWEYVGAKNATDLGTGKIKLSKEQTIKYWDYSASVYHFVAGSPIDAFKYNTSWDETTGTHIESATVTGLAGHYEANNTETALETNPVYIAAPVKIKKDDYQKPVTFTFQRQQSMVRVGLYETIPGYSITTIKFYDADGTTATSSNIILTSATANYFVGGSNVSGTVTYNWETPTPSYTFNYTDNENLKKSKNWYAGMLNVLATTSSEPKVDILYGTDKDMSTTGYFTVLPTPSETTASAILIKCDYTLTSDDGSGETIKVTGATAAIPAAYSKWEANTRYTYLFKISENTNGTTGDPNNPKDPAGLYPITFDAVAKDEKQGTTTTVATPSITTYQEGSVVDNTIKYVANKKIYVTVTESTSGTKQDLSTTGSAVGHIAVYKFTDPITEAEVQVKGTTGGGVTEVTDGSVTDKVYSFTPDGEGYYAIQYLTTAADGNKPAAYTYKVVYVAAATK